MPALHRPLDTRERFERIFGHRLVPYAEARDAGFTRGSLEAAVTRGLLHRPRRGLLTVSPTASSGDGEPRDDAVRAALAAVQPGTWVSQDWAALVHGVARPSSARPGDVELVAPGRAGFVTPGVRVRSTPLPESQRTQVAGIPVTCLARTAVDLARGRRLPEALISLDSAARLLISRATGTEGNALRRAVRDEGNRRHALDELTESLATCFGWAGTVAVRTALHHVDPASESALESRSRGWFIETGLGPLSPGTPIRCGERTYWADFCDPDRRVVGEADGWSKYGRTTGDMRAALERERARQRDLESDGWCLVRWSSTDSRRTVVSRMSQTLGRA
jgi:hypothetical protein